MMGRFVAKFNVVRESTLIMSIMTPRVNPLTQENEQKSVALPLLRAEVEPFSMTTVFLA